MRDLLFSVKARDLTGAVFDKVKKGVAGIDGAFASATERAGRYGDKLLAIGGIMAGITGPLVLAFSDSLSVWDAQEQAMAKVEQAVRRTGAAAGFTAEELAGHAKALQAVTTFGDQDIMGQVTSSLLTFGNVSGDVFLRAQESVADMATVLGTDMQGLAMTLGEALDAPAEGLSALGEAGIVFTEGQTELVKSLVATGDTAAAQGVILDEVARRFGGQARAAAEAGIGPLLQWRNTWTDLKETVGGVVSSLLPPVTSFLSMIAEGFQSLGEPVQRGIVVFVGATAALGTMAIAAGAATLALAPLSLPFVLIAAAIAGAIALCVAFWPEIQKVGKVAREVFLGIQIAVADGMQASVETVVAGANAYVNAYQGAFEAIKSVWGNLPAAVGDLVFKAANAMIAGVEAMINGVISRINVFVNGINAALSTLPEWATGEGGLSISVVPDVNLGRLKNEYEGAIVQTAQDAAAAFTGAFAENPFEVPDLGLKDWSDRAAADLEALRAVPPVVDETATAIDGVGAALDPVVPKADDLAAGLDGVGGAGKSAGAGLSKVGAGAKDASDGVDDLLKGLGDAEGALDGFGRETTDMLKGTFGTGRSEFESFGDFVSGWSNKLLDRVMGAFLDPLGDALQNVFNGILSGGMGGASAGGGFFAGIGNAIGGLLGFDTGGEMAVSGRAGIDRNVAAFRVTQGETIKVTKRGEGGGDRPVNVYIQAADPAAFKASKGRIASDISRAVGHASRFN